jgi:hypothetical protein
MNRVLSDGLIFESAARMAVGRNAGAWEKHASYQVSHGEIIVNGRHVAVLVLPANGHVYTALGLCAELVRRGYRVTCPIEDRFADRVRKTGAETIRLEGYKETERKSITHTPPDLDHDWWEVGRA